MHLVGIRIDGVWMSESNKVARLGTEEFMGVYIGSAVSLASVFVGVGIGSWGTLLVQNDFFGVKASWL